MKILYICTQPDLSQYAKSGPGTHMREMIAAFRGLGHEVRTEIEGDRHYSEETGYKVPPPAGWKRILKGLVPGKVWRSLKDRRLLQHNERVKGKLDEVIRSYQPDLIYERASYLQFVATDLSKAHEIHHILEINAPFAEQRNKYFGSSFYYAKGLAMEHRIVSSASGIAVVSGVLKDYYEQRYEASKGKIIITPNAVNPDYLKLESLEESRRSMFVTLEQELVIGFVGSIFRYHGVEMLINTFPEVLNDHSKVHLLIVGDGENLEELKAKVEQMGLKDKVTFTGSVPPKEVFHWIGAMDITVLPSTGPYMSPIKLFEYGALGKAIIAPNTEPVKEVMEDGTHGLLIEQNEEALKNALLQLCSDVELRRSMGQSFQKKVLEEHTWKRMAERILESLPKA